jgi:DNA-binding MltR family transcriptional regulator
MLDKLLAELKEASLPVTCGFFYGSGEMDKKEYEDLIEIFTAVHKDILENDAEYEYDCWY